MREAVLSDLAQIAAVARAAGQDEKRGGAAAYITHLLAHGRVVVGVSDQASSASAGGGV